MIINFVGNYQSGYVGESADEAHLAREMEAAGHHVQRVPRDIWKAYVEGERDDKWEGLLPVKADINIVAKWHHFTDGRYIQHLKEVAESPVFYWVWDYMWDGGLPDWHVEMARTADLYLSGEAGIHQVYELRGVRTYYFQFDVCDGDLTTFWLPEEKKIHDVLFTGTYLGQGDRVDWLKKINEQTPVTIFSWNHEEWIKQGFAAHPAVYGEAYNKEIAASKVVLGFNVNPNCWGYWSNRVGKVTYAGGFLLQQYAPGMEQHLLENVDYFSSPEEAVEKIKYYLPRGDEREEKCRQATRRRDRFTSKDKVKQLMVLCERYLKGDPVRWNTLP